MPVHLRRNGLLFLCTALFVGLAYFYLDQPVALWTHRLGLRQVGALVVFSGLPNLFVVLAPFLFLYAAGQYEFGRAAPRSLFFALAIGVTTFLKALVKMVFGRYWPETWYHNNPSLLRDHAYGFHFFHAGKMYGSFPSGHAAVTVAAMTAVAFLFPRFRWAAVLVAIALMADLVLLDFHFVSDVVGGALLGYLITDYCWRMGSAGR